MTQTMNNQILLKTLAFCAVVAGIGAVPAVAYEDRYIQQSREFERMQDMWEIERRLDQIEHDRLFNNRPYRDPYGNN